MKPYLEKSDIEMYSTHNEGKSIFAKKVDLGRAVWKSRHRQLGIRIGIGISICIGIAKILVSANEKAF